MSARSAEDLGLSSITVGGEETEDFRCPLK